jgi:hypothetical protein
MNYNVSTVQHMNDVTLSFNIDQSINQSIECVCVCPYWPSLDDLIRLAKFDDLIRLANSRRFNYLMYYRVGGSSEGPLLVFAHPKPPVRVCVCVFFRAQHHGFSSSGPVRSTMLHAAPLRAASTCETPAPSITLKGEKG